MDYTKKQLQQILEVLDKIEQGIDSYSNNQDTEATDYFNDRRTDNGMSTNQRSAATGVYDPLRHLKWMNVGELRSRIAASIQSDFKFPEDLVLTDNVLASRIDNFINNFNSYSDELTENMLVYTGRDNYSEVPAGDNQKVWGTMAFGLSMKNLGGQLKAIQEGGAYEQFELNHDQFVSSMTYLKAAAADGTDLTALNTACTEASADLKKAKEDLASLENSKAYYEHQYKEAKMDYEVAKDDNDKQQRTLENLQNEIDKDEKALIVIKELHARFNQKYAFKEKMDNDLETYQNDIQKLTEVIGVSETALKKAKQDSANRNATEEEKFLGSLDEYANLNAKVQNLEEAKEILEDMADMLKTETLLVQTVLFGKEAKGKRTDAEKILEKNMDVLENNLSEGQKNTLAQVRGLLAQAKELLPENSKTAKLLDTIMAAHSNTLKQIQDTIEEDIKDAEAVAHKHPAYMRKKTLEKDIKIAQNAIFDLEENRNQVYRDNLNYNKDYKSLREASVENEKKLGDLVERQKVLQGEMKSLQEDDPVYKSKQDEFEGLTAQRVKIAVELNQQYEKMKPYQEEAEKAAAEGIGATIVTLQNQMQEKIHIVDLIQKAESLGRARSQLAVKKKKHASVEANSMDAAKEIAEIRKQALPYSKTTEAMRKIQGAPEQLMENAIAEQEKAMAANDVQEPDAQFKLLEKQYEETLEMNRGGAREVGEQDVKETLDKINSARARMGEYSFDNYAEKLADQTMKVERLQRRYNKLKIMEDQTKQAQKAWNARVDAIARADSELEKTRNRIKEGLQQFKDNFDKSTYQFWYKRSPQYQQLFDQLNGLLENNAIDTMKPSEIKTRLEELQRKAQAYQDAKRGQVLRLGSSQRHYRLQLAEGIRGFAQTYAESLGKMNITDDKYEQIRQAKANPPKKYGNYFELMNELPQKTQEYATQTADRLAALENELKNAVNGKVRESAHQDPGSVMSNVCNAVAADKVLAELWSFDPNKKPIGLHQNEMSKLYSDTAQKLFGNEEKRKPYERYVNSLADYTGKEIVEEKNRVQTINRLQMEKKLVNYEVAINQEINGIRDELHKQGKNLADLARERKENVKPEPVVEGPVKKKSSLSLN